MEQNALADVAKAQIRLEEIAPVLEDPEKLADELNHSPDYIIPEASSFETAKSYREKKAKPLFDKIINVLHSINRKYLELINNFNDMNEEYEHEKRRRSELEKHNQLLENENIYLKKMARNFKQIVNYFGKERVDNVLDEIKEREAHNEIKTRSLDDGLSR